MSEPLTLTPPVATPDVRALSLHYGGIIGVATITGTVRPGVKHSFWHFSTQVGFIVTDARPVPFVPCKGSLGFFRLPNDVLSKLAQVGR